MIDLKIVNVVSLWEHDLASVHGTKGIIDVDIILNM